MASPRRLKTLREPPSASDIDRCALRAHRVRVSADFGLCCERERYAAPLLVDAPSPSLYAAVSATGSLCVFEASTRSMRSFVLESCESVRFALTGRVFLPTCTRAVSAKGMQRDFQWIASWRQGTVHACSLPTGLWCTAGLEPHVRVLRAHRARVSPDLHSCREREEYATPLLVEVLGARLPVCVYGRPVVRGACPLQCLARVRFALTRRVLLPTCTRAVSAKGTSRESGDNSERGRETSGWRLTANGKTRGR